MPFEPSDVGQLIETIWNVVLDCAVQPVPAPASGREPSGEMVGMVEIAGAWEGVVAITSPAGLVRQAASTMFEVEPGLVSADQLDDTLCELVNIVGGNFKALLPAVTRLGLPFVAKDTGCTPALPRARLLVQLAFETSGFVFLVSIFSAAAAPADTPRQQLQAAV